MKTRDQEYAEKSYNAVSKRIKTFDDKTKKEYKSFAKRFPTLIHTCGLMQALAFAQAKDGMNLNVLEDFIKVLNKTETPDTQAFVSECQGKDLSDYMHTSRNAMLAAGWIKRQADALIEGDE
ncbi:MAG: type III-B CRISPR module-associated protein Cmr5 [Thermoguttaceae bacterium]